MISEIIFVFSWCFLFIALTMFLVALFQKVFNSNPSVYIFKYPKQGLLLSTGYFLLTVLLILGFQAIVPAKALFASPWDFAPGLKPIALPFLLGLIPLAAKIVFGKLFLKDFKLIFNKNMDFFGQWVFLLPLIFINTAIEEISFRMMPISLSFENIYITGLFIPIIFFIGIHFFEAARDRGFVRVLDLLFGGIFFFLIAFRYGLLPAVSAHAAVNISRTISDGNWKSGAFFKIENKDSRKLKIYQVIGFIAAIVIFIEMA